MGETKIGGLPGKSLKRLTGNAIADEKKLVDALQGEAGKTKK